MSAAPPLVSCIITTRNNASTLPALLKSISRQTYPAVEIVVIDNFSTDKTAEIARKYTRLVHSMGPERSAQRNFGVSKAKGKYVLILDSDMELEPTVVAECVAVAREKSAGGVIIPEKSFGSGFWAAVKAEERKWYVGDENIEAERFFSREIFLKAGGYDLRITGPEDWDLPKRTRELAPYGRIASYILHNEGQQSLARMVGKKYYYARKLGTYLSKNRQSALSSQQVYFLRPSVYGNIWKVWRNPPVYLGIWLMLVTQTIAGMTGFMFGKIAQNESEK